MSPEWQDWITHHAAIFALNTEADARMLAEWCGLFSSAGWTPAELREATGWIALHDPPRFRQDQLAALQNRVRRRRQELGPVDEAPDDFGQCALCRGAGLVPVPNPRLLAREEWGTMAVACSCALGNWFAQHGNHLPLRTYETSHPGWVRQMADHNDQIRRNVRTSEATRAVDAALGEIVRRHKLRIAETAR